MGGDRIAGNGRRRLAQGGLSLAVIASGMAALAQDRDANLPDPPRLTFDFSTGLEHSSNPDFVANPTDSATWIRSDLHFGFSDETALSRLALNADVSLRSGIAGSAGETEQPRRRLELSYERDIAGGGLGLDASLDDSRIDFLRPLSDFIDDQGNISLPDDFNDLTGTGWRRALSYGAQLTFGEDGPLTTRLALGGTDLSYRDTTDPSLDDSHRRYADLGFKFAVTAATTADIGLRYSTFRDSDQDDETLSFRAGFDFARPDGSYGLRLEHVDAPDGNRLTVSASRKIERPWGSLDARLGVTRAQDGDIFATGELRLAYDLPSARLSMALSRAVRAGKDDAEEVRTALALSYDRELTPLSNLSFDIGYSAIEPTTASSAGTRMASIGISYGYELTRDWSLNLGATHRRRDEDGMAGIESTVVTLGLSRSFAIGF